MCTEQPAAHSSSPQQQQIAHMSLIVLIRHRSEIFLWEPEGVYGSFLGDFFNPPLFCRTCQKYHSKADFAYLRVFFIGDAGIASFDIPGITVARLLQWRVFDRHVVEHRCTCHSPRRCIADIGQHLNASTCQYVYTRAPCARNAMIYIYIYQSAGPTTYNMTPFPSPKPPPPTPNSLHYFVTRIP